MTREWVAKAESDYDGACEALRSRKKSRRDSEAVIELRAKALNPLDEANLSSSLKDRLPDYPQHQPLRQMEASLDSHVSLAT